MIYIVAEGLSLQEMGWAPMRHNNYAVTEIVSFILVVFIVSAAVTAVLLWAGPAMEQTKSAINLQSTSIQLDALSDLINRVIDQGVGSYQSMSVETETGNFYFDNLSERFVIYCSIYDYDPAVEGPFNFTVEGFEIGSPNPYSNTFTIDILETPTPLVPLDYELYKGNDFETPVDTFSGGGIGEYPVIFPLETITDNIDTKACIRILKPDMFTPGVYIECGEIWIFDLGSLNYEIGSGKAVVENGGVITVTSGGYPTHETSYWNQELLNGSKMATFRITHIKFDEVKSFSGTGSIKAKFQVNAEEVQVLEARTKVFGDIKMKIYGDSSVVSAWYIFYEDKMNFQYSQEDNEITLDILSRQEEVARIKPNYMFSLVYAKCSIDMEGTS